MTYPDPHIPAYSPRRRLVIMLGADALGWAIALSPWIVVAILSR